MFSACFAKHVGLHSGAGSTSVANETDYSVDTLCRDAINVLEETIRLDREAVPAVDPPKVVVVGHSMGGAIAVRVAKRLTPQWLKGTPSLPPSLSHSHLTFPRACSYRCRRGHCIGSSALNAQNNCWAPKFIPRPGHCSQVGQSY